MKDNSLLGLFNEDRGFYVLVGILMLLVLYGVMEQTSSNATDDGGVYVTDPLCSVMGIAINGEMFTYALSAETEEEDDAYYYGSVTSDDVVAQIEAANDDPEITGIMLEIDSPGGSPLAGEEIAHAVKNSEKPVVAVIRGLGLSAAYMAASGADKIFASKYSDVGSIGVTMSYLSNVEKNTFEGYTFEQLSSGKFKDSGSSDKPLTEEERELFMRDVNIMHENFMEDVSENRNIPLEKIKEIADGSSVLGETALALGLIDQIGGSDEAKKYLEELTGVESVLCWY